MIPKPFKSSSATSDTPPQAPRKEWNPYTPYIILSLLVGSQAIQILWLKQERAHNQRRNETKIGILTEVIERVHKGEVGVDVEGLLGTGDELSEKQWAEVMNDLQNEENLFLTKRRKLAQKNLREALKAEEQAEEEQGKIEKGGEGVKMKVESFAGGKFY